MPFLLFDRTYCKYVACMRLYTVFLHVELQVIALMMQLPILYEVFSPLLGWYKGASSWALFQICCTNLV